ncbi:MAG: hypothetical protein K6F77_06185 [Lachnospiraceae bacterium]|nr:hypothetical protein [Lachnospiraceae bacterium]
MEREIIYKVISENINIDILTIREDSRFLEDFGMDEIDFKRLIIILEEKFLKICSEDDIKKIKTVADLINVFS